MKTRIDKLLSDNLNLSRKQVKSIIAQGRVKVDGAVVLKGEEKAEEQSVITLDGKEVAVSKFVYIMLNKPKGVVSAGNDRKDVTVVDILPDELKRKNLFPAGRLDKDTVGFVLLTDDGDFAHRILSSKNHVEKTYIARIEKNLSDEDIERFEKGISFDEETQYLGAKCRMVGDRTAEVKIVEGKYHQIKRMFLAVGNKVLELKRTSIGGLELDGSLREGEARRITPEELDMIM
ncbi:MAG: 16S rRNA pseudouridine(516) synthase [Clostridia bacterium]|nr:16S rRNA pseudouridine(516) synthase [Clostridia bacterium]